MLFEHNAWACGCAVRGSPARLSADWAPQGTACPPSCTAGPVFSSEAAGLAAAPVDTRALQCPLPAVCTQPLWIEPASGIGGQFHGRGTHGPFDSVRTRRHSSDSLGNMTWKRWAQIPGWQSRCPILSAGLSICRVTFVLGTHADFLLLPGPRPPIPGAAVPFHIASLHSPTSQMSSLSPDSTAMKWVVYQTLLRRPCRNRKGCTGPRAGSDLHRPPDTTVWTTRRPSVPWGGELLRGHIFRSPGHGPLQRPRGVLSLPLCQLPVCKNSVHFFCWTVLLSLHSPKLHISQPETGEGALVTKD